MLIINKNIAFNISSFCKTLKSDIKKQQFGFDPNFASVDFWQGFSSYKYGNLSIFCLVII